MSEAILRATGVTKSFVEGGSTLTVLRGVDLTVHAGECVALVGASGSGKSTLLHILGGLDQATSGTVTIGGASWAGMDEAAKSLLRNEKLGFVYQFHHLLAEFTALENVAMPLIIRKKAPRAQALQQAARTLESVGLGARVAHVPGKLSGGERQRVAVARALVTRPGCVLADEPTGNLDRETAVNVFAQMTALAREQGTAFVIATHDATLAQSADRILRMKNGVLES
jgi:lipoprotein-releasing system ATP-binding protein